MKSKKGILAIIFSLLFLTNIYAQEYKPAINRDYKTYSQLVMDKKFEEAMQYTSPEVFKIFPKNSLIQAMKAAFAMPGLEFHIELPDIINYGELKTIDQIDYIRFSTLNIFRIKTEETQNAEPAKYLIAFKKFFGDENVSYDENTKLFRIESIKDVLASSTDKGQNWKFIVLDNEKIINILQGIIPSEVLIKEEK